MHVILAWTPLNLSLGVLSSVPLAYFGSRYYNRVYHSIKSLLGFTIEDDVMEQNNVYSTHSNVEAPELTEAVTVSDDPNFTSNLQRSKKTSQMVILNGLETTIVSEDESVDILQRRLTDLIELFNQSNDDTNADLFKARAYFENCLTLNRDLFSKTQAQAHYSEENYRNELSTVIDAMEYMKTLKSEKDEAWAELFRPKIKEIYQAYRNYFAAKGHVLPTLKNKL